MDWYSPSTRPLPSPACQTSAQRAIPSQVALSDEADLRLKASTPSLAYRTDLEPCHSSNLTIRSTLPPSRSVRNNARPAGRPTSLSALAPNSGGSTSSSRNNGRTRRPFSTLDHGSTSMFNQTRRKTRGHSWGYIYRDRTRGIQRESQRLLRRPAQPNPARTEEPEETDQILPPCSSLLSLRDLDSILLLRLLRPDALASRDTCRYPPYRLEVPSGLLVRCQGWTAGKRRKGRTRTIARL